MRCAAGATRIRSVTSASSAAAAADGAYDEMCGGRNADQECYECFECSSGGGRCVPIEGCVPSCVEHDDCTRDQVCVEDEFVCRLPGGRPCGGYRDSEDCDDAGMGSKRKGGKGNRGNVDND